MVADDIRITLFARLLNLYRRKLTGNMDIVQVSYSELSDHISKDLGATIYTN